MILLNLTRNIQQIIEKHNKSLEEKGTSTQGPTEELESTIKGELDDIEKCMEEMEALEEF